MIYSRLTRRNLPPDYLENDMKFIIATKNKHKLSELQRILSPLNIDAICENDLDFPLDNVEETGETFEENARLKAVAACEQTGIPAIADDSGLCVDALLGEPGIFSARYSKSGKSEDNIDKLLENMKETPEGKRTARFVCVICVVYPDGKEITVRGECEGKIAFAPQGNGGFGYDPVFISEKGCFALISDAEKNEISHRGQALKRLYEALLKN